MRVARLPELRPGDPDAPLLPAFDINIDNLELVDFTLAPGIAGDVRRRVNLVGSADIRDGRAMVKANGRFGEGDRLVVDLTAEPDGDIFDAEQVRQALKGQDAAIVAVGAGARGQVRSIDRSIQSILAEHEGRWCCGCRLGQAEPKQLLRQHPRVAVQLAAPVFPIG